MNSLSSFFPYSAETCGVAVRVAVSFLSDQSDPSRGHWFWSYHIRLENQGRQEVQLLTRRWIVTDGRGARHYVEGEGVVGEQPLIPVGGTFDYVSGCPLDTATGAMEGSYRMVAADGGSFDVAIPKFPLIGPAVAR